MTEYIDGLAVHWYADRVTPTDLLDETANAYPDKFIIATEACAGSQPYEVRKPVLGMWKRMEEYTMDIIEDLNHYVSAWVDWNLLLDEDGGPNYAQNYVDAPIISNGKEVYKQPMFYALGHFSRFITPDSVRIKSKPSNQYVKATSFIRPDGYTVVVLYNQ
jgi:glucosylceramidase